MPLLQDTNTTAPQASAKSKQLPRLTSDIELMNPEMADESITARMSFIKIVPRQMKMLSLACG